MADPTPGTPPAAAAAAPVALVPGTPEYDAAMVAKADAAAGTTPPAAPVRPDNVPEKFWNATTGAVNVEALLKSYTELEKVKPAAPATPPAATPTTPGAKLEVPTDDAATKAVADAGLDMGKLQSEFAQHGDLTPETRAALDAKGYPKEIVDGYIAGQKALAASYDAAAFEAAGGQAEYGKLTDWAKTGLSDGEKVAFNKAVTSGDVAQAQLAIAGLKARQSAALGSPPALTAGSNASGVSGESYESMAQVTADMRKPEYKNDPAFRAKVAAKLDRSNVGAMQVRG